MPAIQPLAKDSQDNFFLLPLMKLLHHILNTCSFHLDKCSGRETAMC